MSDDSEQVTTLIKELLTGRLGSDAFQKAHSAGIWLSKKDSGRLGRFTSVGSLCDHPSDRVRER
jgi:hypothetical protein